MLGNCDSQWSKYIKEINSEYIFHWRCIWSPGVQVQIFWTRHNKNWERPGGSDGFRFFFKFASTMVWNLQGHLNVDSSRYFDKIFDKKCFNMEDPVNTGSYLLTPGSTTHRPLLPVSPISYHPRDQRKLLACLMPIKTTRQSIQWATIFSADCWIRRRRRNGARRRPFPVH